MTALDLDAIEARANAATPGPWYQGRDSRRYESPGEAWTREDENAPDSYDLYPQWHREDDAAFVAHAREDVPALIAEVRRLSQRPSVEQVAAALWAAEHYDTAWHTLSAAAPGRRHYLTLAEVMLALFPTVEGGECSECHMETQHKLGCSRRDGRGLRFSMVKGGDAS